MHGGQAGAGQQKAQGVSQAQLFVDGGQQQDRQREPEGQARCAGQDVGIALAHAVGVAARMARGPPGLQVLAP